MSTILIVDEDADARDVMNLVFARAGFEVLCAADGFAAMSLAERHLPDVVLTDVDLPGMDGAQLCRSLRAHPLLSATPIAVLSGFPGDDPRIVSTRCGAVMVEPAPNEVIVDTVRALIPGI